MKRLLFPLLVGAVALLAPGRSLAQEKPVLNSAPIVIPAQPTPAPAPAPADTTRRRPAKPTYTPPAGYDEPQTPQPGTNSPSGLELPGREQARKAAQQHANQYTKYFIYTGAGLGYSSDSYSSQFSVSASPAIGYRLSDRFSIGPGISYAYNNYGFATSANTSTHIATSNFGVKVFGQAMVIDNFFVHAEYEVTKAELLAVDSRGNLTGGTVSRSVQTPLAGVGYRSKFSDRAAADIVLLYNFQDNYNSIYPNPVLRFNFLFNIGR